MQEAPRLLNIEGLEKRFGSETVLKDVHLDVSKGEAIALIGPSGSGKSTLLRCINRLESIQAGKIWMEDADISAKGVDINALRRQIGFVFQAFNLYPHMTALGNVALALRWSLGLSRQEAVARATASLLEVGLGEKLNAYPAELSGGQQQRVGIARALTLEPKLMLLDEPTSALDPELVGEVLGVIARMKQRGMTMLIVTHELGFARQVADRIIFLADGEIIETGPPSTLLDQPQQPRTKQFLARLGKEWSQGHGR